MTIELSEGGYTGVSSLVEKLSTEHIRVWIGDSSHYGLIFSMQHKIYNLAIGGFGEEFEFLKTLEDNSQTESIFFGYVFDYFLKNKEYTEFTNWLEELCATAKEKGRDEKRREIRRALEI